MLVILICFLPSRGLVDRSYHATNSRGMHSSGSGSYAGCQHMCFSAWSRLALQWNPDTFLFDFLLFLIIFLCTFQEVISALRVLNTFHTYMASSHKNLALNLLVYSHAKSMRGNTASGLSPLFHGHVGRAFLFELPILLVPTTSPSL